jgi:galactokinase
MIMDIRQRTVDAFLHRFGAGPDFIARAPGRVNLLGEHVDYNDGFVLPAALDRATYVAFRRSNAPASTLLALDLGEEASFTSESIQKKKTFGGMDLPDWSLYPAGVMWSLNSKALDTPPVEAVFTSDVPRGAGLSSSASVELSFAVTWQKLGEWSLPPMELALISQRAENKYVGVNCGIMDQFASACGVRDRILLLDCRSLEWKTLGLPADVSLVIADTSIRRSLTGSAYNDRRAACEEAVRILQGVLPSIASLRDVSLETFNQYAHLMPPLVEKRARHIVEEIARTRLAVPFLEAGDIRQFGQLMNQCHISLRDLYEVSSPELDIMAEIAQALPGCYGARLTGAGFGGCTVNLVAQSAAGKFATDLAQSYEQRSGLHPEIYICHASPGASVAKN